MPEFDFDDTATANEHLLTVAHYDRAESCLAYHRYLRVEALFAACCDQAPTHDLRVFDTTTQTAARLSAVRRVGQRGSENLVAAAIALVWRIPLIGLCLRDGIITDWQFRLLVSRTDLIEGADYCPDVDAEIAAELRRTGVWSKNRLKDMADRMVFRHDPDAVRRARQAAHDARGVWTADKGDGMSELGVIASAEEILLANAAIEALARATCKNDPRTIDQRRSDAVICRLQQLPFECACQSTDCDATMNDDSVSDRQARIMLVAICSADTLQDPPDEADTPDDNGPAGGGPADNNPTDGGPTDNNPTDGGPTESGPTPGGTTVEDADKHSGRGDDDPPLRAGTTDSAAPSGTRAPRNRPYDRPGFLDGHGVISAGHIREIARRSNVVIRYLNKDPDTPLRTYQPSNHYRPSTALDTYVRVRDGYCTFPGCAKRAWKCQLDHVTEFDHTDPATGGQTCPCNTDAKCEFHHLLKTFGNWLDDLYLDKDGHTHVMYRTPEGLVVESGGHTSEALFPELLQIRFADPSPKKPRTTTPRGGHGPGVGPLRPRPRTEQKHARRLYERKKNREDRALRESAQKEAEARSPLAADYLNDDPPF